MQDRLTSFKVPGCGLTGGLASCRGGQKYRLASFKVLGCGPHVSGARGGLNDRLASFRDPGCGLTDGLVFFMGPAGV